MVSPLRFGIRKLVFRSLLLLGLTLGSSAVFGQASYVWTGGGSDNNWSTGANWAGGVAPSNPQAYLHFGGTTQTTSNDNIDNYGPGFQILFDSGAGAFTLTGNAINFYDYGGVDPKFENDSTSLQTISLSQIDVEHSMDFYAASGSMTFTSGSPIYIDNSSTLYLTAGSGNTLTFNDTINNPGSVVIGTTSTGATGSGNVVFTGANSYTGTTTINTGTLTLGNGGATGSLSTSSTITDNGTLAFNRSNAVTQGTDFSGSAISGTGGINQMGTGTLTLNAANTYTGLTMVGSGALDLANQYAIQSSTLNLIGTGALIFDSSVSGNVFTIGALSGTGNIALQNNAATPAAVTLSAGGNNANTTYSGILSGAGGVLSKEGTGTLLLSGANTYSGQTNLDSGTIAASNNTALGTGNVYIGNGGSSSANVNAALLLSSSGLTVSNLLVTNKADTGSGFGTGTRTIGGTFTSGTSTFSGNIYLNGGAVLTSAAGGTVNFSGPIADAGDTGNVSRAVTVAGPGTIEYSAANTYSGTTTVAAGELQFAMGGSAANSAVNLGDTSGANNATITMLGSGQTLGNTINVQAGSSGIATLRSQNTAGTTNSWTGAITLGKSLTVAATNSGATLQLGMVSATSPQALFVGDATTTNAGTVSLTGTADNVNLAATVNSGTLVLAVTSSASTHAIGAGLTVNNGATVQLGNNSGDQIYYNSAVTINKGGTFATAGYSEGSSTAGATQGVGALTLAGGSTIDFGVGANGSTLSAGSGTITGTGTISILDWTGAANTDSGATGNDRLLFVTDPAFTASQLAQFQFSNDSGTLFATGAEEISYDGFTEIVPVPEPATALSGFLLLGACGVAWKRRFLRAA